MGYYGRTTNFWNASMSASFPITVVIADDHTIVRRGLVSSLEHAAYLGYELRKAEWAMLAGGRYVQDRKDDCE